MRRGAFMVAVALLGMVATVVWAQGIPVPSTVQVETPDGGLAVTLGAQRVAVEATGPGGGNVAVSGTVGLTSQSIADLTAPQCGQIFPLEKLHLDAGVASPLPPFLPDGGFGGDPNRSSFTIQITDTAAGHTVACDLLALDAGLPTCSTSSGHAPILRSGDIYTWNVGQSRVIYCLPCNVQGVDIGWREENCR